MTAPYIAPDGAWTLGVKIGLPFACVAALLLVAIAVVVVWFWLDDTGPFSLIFTLPGSLVVLGLYVGGMLWAYWPLDSQYHQYREVRGTVDRISSRLISAGDHGGTDQKFVVVFQGSAQQFAVNDTRASLVKPGDQLTLSCIRVYDYASTAGYDCKWGTP